MSAEAERPHFGGQSMVAPLRRVLLRAPRAQDLACWREAGWLAAPDLVAAEREHAALCAALTEAGAEVELSDQPADGNADSIYVCDPALLCDQGILLLAPGKASRAREPEAMGRDLARLGVPVTQSLGGGSRAEGGDLAWLDERTLLVGRSFRTNDAGVAALREALPGVEVVAFDLPHLKGAGSCLHLMSLLSPLADDLIVAYPPLLPVRLVQLLAERSIRIVAVPDAEFDTMGANVLALAPRVGLALDGNPITRRGMEAAGVDVRGYTGREISLKGEGGPTCLTRPLWRQA